MVAPDRMQSVRRARISFWILVLASVLAAGALGSALRDDPAPMTGLRVAVSGLVLVVAVTLATRILLAFDRARRTARQAPPVRPGHKAP